MGTTTNDRRRKELEQVAAISEDDLFFDPEAAPNTEKEEQDRAVRVKLSPLHLLLMLDAEGCFLHRGIEVTFKKDGLPGVIHDFDKVETKGQIFGSLGTATQRAVERKTGDGWTQTYVSNPVEPGKPPLTLNKVFHETWRTLGVPLEVLEDVHALAERLYSEGRIDAVTYERYRKKNTDKKPAQKSGKKASR